MLTIKVKFTTGIFKVFENVDAKNAGFKDGVLTIPINQKIDENGKWLSGSTIRMPLVNIMYFESVDSGDSAPVEGEGKVVE